MATLIPAYLWFNAAGFALLGVLCIVAMRSTSRGLGYVDLTPVGKTEFMTIYGGMQLSFSLIFALIASLPEYHHLGLVFGVLLYSGVVLMRLLGLLIFKPRSFTIKSIALLEVLMLAIPGALLATGH